MGRFHFSKLWQAKDGQRDRCDTGRVLVTLRAGDFRIARQAVFSLRFADQEIHHELTKKPVDFAAPADQPERFHDTG
jgi:hypothetical protein